MQNIYESKNFIVNIPDDPHITRKDGGHLKIEPKEHITDRFELKTEQGYELFDLTIAAGRALKDVLTRQGIEIGRINYQQNGNWGVNLPETPTIHVHIYGRAVDAKIQKYGDALYLPDYQENYQFYKNNVPLNQRDGFRIGLLVQDYFKRRSKYS